jgi:hypothetical protein
VTDVINQPGIEATNLVGTAVGPTDGIHRSTDARALAAAEPATSTQRSASTASPSSETSDAATGPRASESADDSGQGLAMFLIFTSAVLTATGAVAMLALVDSWWMLGVAFAIHVAMTAVVVLTILYAVADRTRAIAARSELAPAWAARFDARPPTEAVAAAYDADLQPAAPTVTEHGSGSPAGRVGFPIERAPRRPRVLMVTDENLAVADEVPEPIRPLVTVAEEVYVVAPTLTTRLQSLTGDVDRARASAQERLGTVFDHMHADGLESRGVVGDEDQVAAIADALTDFEADLMVLRLHARGSENENWREHMLAKRVRSRFELPTVAFYFDADGHVIGREDDQSAAQA